MKCAIAAMLIAAAFALLLLSRRGWNAGALVVAGDQFTDARSVPIPVEPHSAGYDGQFYYRLALDPFTNQWTDHGIRLDVPTYRQQRIFLPLVAWLVAAGRPRAVAPAILLINIAAVGLLAFSSARIVEQSGANAWWSAAAWMYPGWILSMARDCAEILEVALLVTMIMLVQRHRTAVGAIVATCAALAKETALLAIAGFAFAAPWLVVAIAAQLGWKFALFHIWHAAPSLGTGHFSIPFAGLATSLHLARPFPLFTDFEIASLLGPLALAGWSAGYGRPKPLLLAFALYIPLLAVLDQGFWVEDWSFMRAATEYWVLGALIARNRAAVALSVVTWCAVAYHVLFIR